MCVSTITFTTKNTNAIILIALIFFPIISIAQHQTLSSQGGVYTSNSKIVVSQSIGQASVIGQYSNALSGVVQGFQQPYWDKLISNNWESLDILISPNPFVNQFSIIYAEDAKMNLSLYDLTGKLVYRKGINFNGPSELVEINGLAVGTYLTRIEINGQDFFTKLLKE